MSLNIGLTNLGYSDTNYTIQDRFKIEINYNIARENLENFLAKHEAISNAIDNVLELQNVANAFNSKEALCVVKTLVGNSLAGISVEGFFSSAWENIKKFFQWIWGKIKAFFSWIWNKIKSLFGKGGDKVPAPPDSALARIAKKNPRLGKLLRFVGLGKESLSYSNEEDGVALSDDAQKHIQAKFTLSQVYELAMAMSDDSMTEPVEYAGYSPERLLQIIEKIEAENKEVMPLFDKALDELMHNKLISAKTKLGVVNDVVKRMKEIMQSYDEKTKTAFEGDHYGKYDQYRAAAHLAKGYTKVIDKLRETQREVNDMLKAMDNTGELQQALRESVQAGHINESDVPILEKGMLQVANRCKTAAQGFLKTNIKLYGMYMKSVASFCNTFNKAIGANSLLS